MIVEAEALVRWSEAQGGAIGPDVFVRIAEERGFVGEITRFVVRRVLDEMGGVMRRRRDFRVSVNVAAQDLADPDFMPMLKNQLTRADVQPETLGIEITESFTARHQIARDTIARLRLLGHHVAIDDFGTGYSSLAYLHDLAADTIKIDKVFTQAIGTEAITVSILPQILSIAAKLDLNVTVEGIETDEQARYFVGAPMRVRAQGWLFGHPVSSVALQELLAKDDARIAARTGHGTLTVISSKR
jgi:sensor c-di-GMP phosphodiesterase-like protein